MSFVLGMKHLGFGSYKVRSNDDLRLINITIPKPN